MAQVVTTPQERKNDKIDYCDSRKAGFLAIFQYLLLLTYRERRTLIMYYDPSK